MKLQDILKCAMPAMISLLISTLEHEKSFLMQNGAATANKINFYKDSLLITSSNDIVQKDIETGVFQRTFRAHSSQIFTFFVTNDSRMITSSYDDSVIVWDLVSGSVRKRIPLKSSNTIIRCMYYMDEQVFTGGFDGKLRQIDLVTAKVVKIIDYKIPILCIHVSGDFVYVGKADIFSLLVKLHISTLKLSQSFEGHESSVFALAMSEKLLFSGSADTTIICWNSEKGSIIRRFIGHSGFVNDLKVLGNGLYSTDSRSIIKWNINDGLIARIFAVNHTLDVQSILLKETSLFSGSLDGVVMRWDILTGLPFFTYKEYDKALRTIVLWANLVISGGDDGKLKAWDTSVQDIEPYFVVSIKDSSIGCLYVYGYTLFSGSSDRTIWEWNLTNFHYQKQYTGHSGSVDALVASSSFLYSAGSDNVVKQWNISSGVLTADFVGHINYITSLQLDGDFLLSGSWDLSIKKWNIESTVMVELIRVRKTVYSFCVLDDKIVAGISDGLAIIQTSTLVSMVFEKEDSDCYSIASSKNRIYSGHLDGIIKSRDIDTLDSLNSFRGHVDFVMSLCLDVNDVLYSASYDGSIKRWNMVNQQIAFSFENRSASVDSLAVARESIFVGTRSGAINSFNINTATFIRSYKFHDKAVAALVERENRLYSCGLDGLLLEHSLIHDSQPSVIQNSTGQSIRSLEFTLNSFVFLQGEAQVVILPFNRSFSSTKTILSPTPVNCLAATETFIFVGSKSGVIFAWSIENLRIEYDLKDHTFQVNYLLAHRGSLFSASNDNTIIQWYLSDQTVENTFKRQSSSILGHLGPVNSISICKDVLFSAGSDATVRRWSLQTGKHEDVYTGLTKAVTSVVCSNNSVFAGGDDFAVLRYEPILPDESPIASTNWKNGRSITAGRKVKVVQKGNFSASENIMLIFTIILIVSVLVLLIGVAIIILKIQAKTGQNKKALEFSYGAPDMSTNLTDMQTVINTVIGISKHAAYLIESSLVARVKKLTSGGGGELILAKVMDSTLRKRFGEIVVQKLVFIRNNTITDAFYQEVGVMIMLSTFPHFCLILGYTENPLSIILKYYPDGSLYEFLRKIKLKTRYVLKILNEVSVALNIMHAHYLAHCDIKSQNVLVEVSNNVPSCYLTDFGIAQILSEKIIATKAFNVINLRGLSVSYAAPEALDNFRSKKFSGTDFKKYDIYSLACVTFEVLTKQMPWS